MKLDMEKGAKYCAFTICTGSYKGLATALKDSFLKYNDEYDFYVIYTDQIPDKDAYAILGDDVIASYDANINTKHLQFKYNIAEYATCLKPFSFMYFFKKGYEKALYFDPDILFFSRFYEISDNDSSIFLTPHILKIPDNDEDVYGEINFLRFGTFNCGFVGFNKKTDSVRLIDWWARRLLNHSFAYGHAGCYTDQKWMDLAPALLDTSHVDVIRNPGCDIATWNYHERKIDETDGGFNVSYRKEKGTENDVPVVFVHYSGYNFKRLVAEKDKDIFDDVTEYRDTDALAIKYRDALNNANTVKYFSLPYKYGQYENGDTITAFHRRIFNGLIDNGYRFDNPFEYGKNSFYELLKRKKFKLEKNKEYSGTASDFGILANISNNRHGRFKPFLRLMFRLFGEQKYATILNALKRYTDYDENYFLAGKDDN